MRVFTVRKGYLCALSSVFGDCTHGPLLSLGADPEAALAVFGEAKGK